MVDIQASRGTMYVFLCNNIYEVPRMLFEDEAAGRGLKQLQRDPTTVNAIKQTCATVVLAICMIPYKNKSSKIRNFIKSSH